MAEPTFGDRAADPVQGPLRALLALAIPAVCRQFVRGDEAMPGADGSAQQRRARNVMLRGVGDADSLTVAVARLVVTDDEVVELLWGDTPVALNDIADVVWERVVTAALLDIAGRAQPMPAA